MKTKFLFLAQYYILGLILISPILLKAQCDRSVVVQANDDYIAGNFDAAVDSLKHCAFSDDYTKATSSLQVEALSILAEAYIAKDDLVNSRLAVIKLLQNHTTFEPRPEAPTYFKELVKKERIKLQNAQVASVSKIGEDLHEAPATVVQITAEQIKRRGYMDLEQLLHDLPGFDISRSNGILYSNIYQRGYRSINTNRMLLIIDGVEDNDLWGNLVYLSRQYPISNIKSVEVIYGPASTIYGANAYAGVIHINTKNPIEMIGNGKRIGVIAETGYGAWNTRYVDATLAMTTKDNKISFSATGRVFLSDEHNFGGNSFNDFEKRELNDPFLPLATDSTFSDLFEKNLNITDANTAKSFYRTYKNHSNASFFKYENDSILLTQSGLKAVNDIENNLWDTISYSDDTKAFAFSTKIKFENLTLGWQYWQKQEGAGVFYNDFRQAGTDQKQYWAPYSHFLYLKYDKRINKSLRFINFTQYKLHGLTKETKIVTLKGYSHGGLQLEDLLAEKAASFVSNVLTIRNNQLRSENILIYEPSKIFNLIGGAELRSSAIQDTYSKLSNTISKAQDHFFFTDIGVYSHLKYQFDEKITLKTGVRYDYNVINDTLGLGKTATTNRDNLSVRTALIYHIDSLFVFKGIFGSTFRDATNLDRYSEVENIRIANPNLKPERGNNYEISLRYFFNKQKNSSIEIASFLALYKDVIAAQSIGTFSGTTQFQNTGRRNLRGIQISADYHWNSNIGNFYFYSNYTFTDVKDEIPKREGSFPKTTYGDTLKIDGEIPTELRVGDIAKHQINFGVNYSINQNWNINLRANFVGDRETGEGTTVYGNQTTLIEPYIVLYSAVSYCVPKLGITIQGVVNNVFNDEYYSPGLREADNWRYTSALPQNPINFHVKVKWDFSFLDI